MIALYVVGVFCACVAILRSRTPQGATAWALFLTFFPMIAVPLFMIFGRSKFEGYNSKRRVLDLKVQEKFDSLKNLEDDFELSAEMRLLNQTISEKNQPGFTRKNSIKLLIDGQETYEEMRAELEKATDYIVFQVYTFRADEVGESFKEILIRKAKEGVRVTFLNDDIGERLSSKWEKEFTEAGVKISSFNASNGRGKLQINFRNHRKIIVIDGRVAFVGGHNIGREYLGKTKTYGHWRDTHVRLEGPSVIAAQLATAKDWYCCKEVQLDADWTIHPAKRDSHVLVLHSGPADLKNTCLLAHIALINMAKERIWIANAYFVPPESLVDALILAKLRGVDVRIIVPTQSDSRTVLLASRVYQERLMLHGIKIYRYRAGFLHQKTMLVDQSFGVVGSANFDCRSMFINFEIATISNDETLITQMDEMLTRDMADSEAVFIEEFRNAPLLKKIACRGANLLSPVL